MFKIIKYSLFLIIVIPYISCISEKQNSSKFWCEKEIKKGITLFNQNQTSKSIEYFLELEKKGCYNKDSFFYIGITAAKALKKDIAIKYLDETIKLDPNNWIIYKHYGKMYKSLYEYKKSYNILKNIFKISDGDAESNYLMAFTSLKVKKYKDVEKHYKKAIEFDPHYMLAYLHYGGYLFQEGRYDKAEEIWRKGLLHSPDHKTILERIASIPLAEKKYDKGIKYSLELLKKDPKNINGYFNLAKCYEMTKNYKKAIEQYEKIILISKNNRFAYQSIAELYQKNGEFKKSIKIWTDLYNTHKDNYYLFKKGSLFIDIKDKENFLNIVEKLKKVEDKRGKEYLKLLKKLNKIKNGD